VLARTGIAALLLVPIAVARDELRPLVRHWVPVIAFAGVEIAVPWVLLGAAEQEVSSSLTALLIAAVPLIGAVIARTSVNGCASVSRACSGSWSGWGASSRSSA